MVIWNLALTFSLFFFLMDEVAGCRLQCWPLSVWLLQLNSGSVCVLCGSV
jgi:hypothetical protein